MDRIEKESWHTTRRENASDYELAATPEIWGRIVEAITVHQNKHGGSSPTDPQIAKMLGVANVKVTYHVWEMMKKGLIVEEQKFPRVLRLPTLKPTTEAPTPEMTKHKEAKVASIENGLGGFFTQEAFLRCARAIADATIRYYEQHGQQPGARHISEMLGYKSVSTVSLTVEAMVRRGWFSHTKYAPADYAVTGLGREILDLNRPVNAMEPSVDNVPVPQAFPPVSIEVRRAMSAPDQRLDPALLATRMAPDVRDDLSKIDTVDLLLELQARGLKVSR